MPKKNEKKIDVNKLPYNIENEQFLLGEILVNNDIAGDCVPNLKKEDFFDAHNGEIFEAMKRIQDSNKPIDFLTVVDELGKMGKLEDVGGEDYIASLTDGVVSTVNAMEHLKMIKRDSVLRQIVAAGNNICEVGYSGKSTEDAMLEVEKEIRAVSEGLELSELKQCGDAASAALEQIKNAQSGNVSIRNIYTGFELLDKKTKGMKPGAVYVLAARPGIGKTAFALNIAGNVALNYKKRVAVFSLEMDAPSLIKRILSQRTLVSHDEMDERGAMSELQVKKVMDAYKALYDSQLYIDDFALNTPSQIFNKCKRLERNGNRLDLVIIDYLQLMNSEKDSSNANRQEAVAQLSRSIKVYAKELQVPIIILSQLRRAPLTEEVGKGVKEDRKPQLSDLRESGSIEQDADMVMFLHKPKGIDSTQDGSLIELLIQKNRSGALGTINLAWYPTCTTFIEHPNQKTVSEQENTEPSNELKTISEADLKKKAFAEEDASGDNEFDDVVDTSDGDLEI